MRRLLEALNRSRKDLRAMLKLLENGKMLDGRSYIIHNARDPVASPDLSLLGGTTDERPRYPSIGGYALLRDPASWIYEQLRGRWFK